MRPILLSTVGTSLFFPNLAGLKRTLDDDVAKPVDRRSFTDDQRAVAEELIPAYATEDWSSVAQLLGLLPSDHRACGAEINSITSLRKHAYIPSNAGLYFFHSDTDDGRAIADVLVRYYRACGHAPVEAVPIPDLQDKDPKRFRTHGLRNLAKLICSKINAHGADACAFNATGGYKAQVAVAVLLGQALGIPVYYMHERFSEIIAFPPLPVSLDFEVWMRASGLLQVLERETSPVARTVFDDDEWDERYESLVETVLIDGVQFVELSAAGQIFHETFRERFRSQRDRVLPPAAIKKLDPVLHDHGVTNLLKVELTRYLTTVTNALPGVTRCVTNYCNPQLNDPTRFRVKGEEVQGIYTDGTRTVKFLVETTATTSGQRSAVVAALNEWLRAQQ